MFKFTNVASLGVNFALLNLLVVMRLEMDLDKIGRKKKALVLVSI